uniref:Uncharacterized protein n=1 Tax=Plectus sambesii TaxID=2011161 RepID=A0A914VDM1_9BILA
MQLILVISLCVVTAYAQSYANLRFTHPVMGEMKVSTKKYPMLTPVEMPEIVYIAPSSQQLKAINEKAGRKRRQTIDPSFQSKVRSFLSTEFGNNVIAANLPAISDSQLPFKSFDMASDFEILIIPRATFAQFMQWYLVKLRVYGSERPGKNAPFPAQEIYNRLNGCPWVQNGNPSAGNPDIRFQSDNGGVMTDLKTTCTLDPNTDTIIFGLSYYGTRFKREPVAKPTQITQEWNSIMDASKKTLTT